MLKELVKKFKSVVDDTEEIDEKYFAEVMKEIKDGYKEDGLEGKAIAMSGGDEKKANSIYMQLRAEYLQERLPQNRNKSSTTDDRFYEQVADELERDFRDKGIYTKAIADSGGDKDKLESIYIRLRAKALQDKAIQEHREALLKEEREKKEKEEKEKERLANDELYQALHKLFVEDILKLYQKEIEDLGYTRASFFSRYYLKKDGNEYYISIKRREKKMLIYTKNPKLPETTFTLEDKADEIIALAKGNKYVF